MLKRIYIENYALIDKLEVEFALGLNVITGETGAGKSLIVGALSRLLGGHAAKDDIRSGKSLAVIEAEFDIYKSDEIISVLNHLGFDTNSELITLRREIPVNRASRSFINGQLVNLKQLRLLTVHLVELFGQHSHQQLLDENYHLTFLDQFAELTDQVESLGDRFTNWQTAKKKLADLRSNIESARKERELLLFQKDEIEKAGIRDGEEEELLKEKKLLDGSLILGEKSSLILELIDREENSALNSLNASLKEISEMTRIDNDLGKISELLNNAVINLGEFRSEMEIYQNNIPNDPNRLEEINLRLDEIYRLKNKYGGSEEAIHVFCEEISSRLDQKIDVDQQILNLSAKETRLKREYSEPAIVISKKRQKKAKQLSKIVEKELSKLGIESGRFSFSFEYEEDINGIAIDNKKITPSPHGLDNGRFLISANPGEPLKPLVKTASGGEISRIMLALKSANKSEDSASKPVLVFDEIDSGIGGRTAVKVAERIASLSQNYQLIVISHLHQIAALGDHHYAVEKSMSNSKTGRNVINVIKLSEDDRKAEIDRMIALPDETI